MPQFWLLFLSLLFPCNASAQTDDLATELPRIKPLDPPAALRSFKLEPGFRLEAVATEPLVTDPVSACYDADGRLYVAEMRGYPYPEKSPTGFLRLLEDTNRDGTFDKSTIFVEGLSWPTSVVPYDGGVFIAVAPDILYAKDLDGDGKADTKKVMFTGFGSSNVQALLNGLLWGPDGWIYGVSGGNGGEIRNLTKPEAKLVSVRGRDFRFKPDGSAFEAISGGGQFGHAFDDWGHRFTCNNSDHLRQIVLPSNSLERNPALAVDSVIASIAVEGPAAPVFRLSAAEPWRVVRTRQRAADPVLSVKLPVTELVPIGFFTSATGATIYRGNAFPKDFRGNAFIGDVGGNLVHRKALTKRGAIYEAKRTEADHEFLASTDNWFRPVNFVNTPDGALLILDMYRETIEHPLSIPEPIKKHLDLTSGKDLGRLYALVPAGDFRRRPPSLSTSSSSVLVAYLTDGSAWYRETAQRLLIERHSTDAIPLLHDLARSGTAPLGQVHALWTLAALGALIDADVLPAFKSPVAEVREQAAKLSEARLGNGSTLVEPLLALAGDPDPMVRLQTALTLGALRDDRAIDALATIAETDVSDRWTRVAVMSSLAHRAPGLIARLDSKGVFKKPEGLAWLDELSALVAAENDPAALGGLVEKYVSESVDPIVMQTVSRGLGRGFKRSGGSFRGITNAKASRTLAGLFQESARIAISEDSEPRRIAAIQLLKLGSFDLALKKLPPLLDVRHPTRVQLAAIQALGELNDSRVGPEIVGRWSALSPAMRSEASEVLMSRPDRILVLLKAIAAKTVNPSEIEPSRLKTLVNHPDKSIRTEATKVLGSMKPTDRKQVVESYRGALALKGEIGKGRLLFQKNCASCHKADGAGMDVGPNLATVTTRTPDDLLIHILDPNREVAPNYLNYSVATIDGHILTGLIASESANSLILKRAEGASDEIPRPQIEAITSTGLSLMPEGLEKTLSQHDLADLIAFLRSTLPR